MGCAGSKQARLDRQRSPSRFDRSYSAPVRSPDGYRVASVKSSTRGSIKIDYRSNSLNEEMMKSTNDRGGSGREVLGKARAWPETIEAEIPRTPTRTPRHEPETINAWELMAGLEDATQLRPVPHAIAGRSVSFNTVRDVRRGVGSTAKSKMMGGSPPLSTPTWMQAPASESSIVCDFDPEVISSFRKALEELSPDHPFLLHSPEQEKMSSVPRSDGFGIDSNDHKPCAKEELSPHRPFLLPSPEQEKMASTPRFDWADTHGNTLKPTGIVKIRITAFQESIDARRADSNGSTPKVSQSYICPPNGEGKVVFYFTSLRGVRKTYEDCCAVRLILQGYGIKVDERDVSLHREFKGELGEMLGGEGSRLPQIFADGAYLGGAEEVREMHETGHLGRALEGCEMVMVDKGCIGGQCDGCGDVRFVPCENCSGSCKVYIEEEEEGVEEEASGFRRCPDCNENGLVRCPLCC